ncbi:non-hydrolyzing UDP-N-acetylglucosamine 2-epimerase [Saccharopolyspora hattusasensis]|uniref:non-hydrolyzing UDP-N-acetylglucosamine 2-epimerase n=1 Tax=Saccharopolyspora hattusasensis TaxID=1128679 RepID=UPI003D968F31
MAGTRPNYMKIKAVMEALEQRGAECVLVHTGQHYDYAMNELFFKELRIRRPDQHLGVGSGTHAEQTGRAMLAFDPIVAELRPDIVVVDGDDNSTLACALVATKAGQFVAHVEAGPRSGDWSMPEEVNRVAVDSISDVLLAPSEDAFANLRAEGYRQDKMHLVGNVSLDTLLANLDRARARPVLDSLGVPRGGFALVTLHRPSNVDSHDTLGGLLRALAELAQELPVVFPVHPRTRAKMVQDLPHGVLAVDPLGYLDFVALQDAAAVVLTDSGGVQAETTMLGVPCLTLRENTEWPVTITKGTNQLVGRDPLRIMAAARKLIECPPPPRRPALWDGRASQRVAEVLLSGHGL